MVVISYTFRPELSAHHGRLPTHVGHICTWSFNNDGTWSRKCSIFENKKFLVIYDAMYDAMYDAIWYTLLHDWWYLYYMDNINIIFWWLLGALEVAADQNNQWFKEELMKKVYIVPVEFDWEWKLTSSFCIKDLFKPQFQPRSQSVLDFRS